MGVTAIGRRLIAVGERRRRHPLLRVRARLASRPEREHEGHSFGERHSAAGTPCGADHAVRLTVEKKHVPFCPFASHEFPRHARRTHTDTHVYRHRIGFPSVPQVSAPRGFCTIHQDAISLLSRGRFLYLQHKKCLRFGGSSVLRSSDDIQKALK